MNPRQPAADPAADDAEWAGRVHDAASADVRQLLRAARRRRHAHWLAGGLVVVAVGAMLAVLVRAGTLESLLGDDPVAPPVARPVAPEPLPPAPMLDPADPFASTPAAGWADGADGIVLPTAKPVGDFTASEVAAATALVREVLVASRLDRALLVRHDPSRFLSLLAPDARGQLEPLFGGQEPQVQSLVSLVAADTALAAVEPKVRGEMTVAEGEAGELVVSTNYVFVYAFEPAEPLRLVDAMNVIVVVRADVDYVLRDGDRWAPGSQGLWYDDATGSAYSIGCDAYRRGFLAPAATERAVTPGTERAQATYFDPASPAPAPNCPA
ncbi:hypothetical protein [Actinophytocola gossypii]|uniref:Uncharacterized protein n=1 Tax=Actinophytocola gossypii TaxID=2812003 RepID=A0ABT2JHH1_9PSEU|nr:hypothetical protein [Actinophytocola gossypii]MCT2586840.1 hypothetical protein [Actinophytocola gossypii]